MFDCANSRDVRERLPMKFVVIGQAVTVMVLTAALFVSLFILENVLGQDILPGAIASPPPQQVAGGARKDKPHAG